MGYADPAFGGGHDVDFSQKEVPKQAMVDSGVTANFMDTAFATKWNVQQHEVNHQLPATSVRPGSHDHQASSDAYGKPHGAVGVLSGGRSAFSDHFGTGMAPGTRPTDRVVGWYLSAGQS